MNNSRRKKIEKIEKLLDSWEENVDRLRTEIENIKEEEEEALDMVPESFQGTERYDISERAISALDEACDLIDSLPDFIMELIDKLEEARE